MFEKEVEAMAMVMMAKVAEFVEKDVVLKNAWQADDVQIQIDVSLCRTASPVGRIMLDRDTVIQEVIPVGQDGKPSRKFLLRLTAQ